MEGRYEGEREKKRGITQEGKEGIKKITEFALLIS